MVMDGVMDGEGKKKRRELGQIRLPVYEVALE